MKITLLNPPHTAIGSRIPKEHLPPLGLLSIGGPLIDSGFSVNLIDADLRNLKLNKIREEISANPPNILLIGHSGSSSVHKTVLNICRSIKSLLPNLIIIYGGVHPTYHWDEILEDCLDIDFIVRGEGEKTIVQLVNAIQNDIAIETVEGIAFRVGGKTIATTAASLIENLDEYRVGWELIAHGDYSYWGGMRAVVVQFSRGCPYLCNYCGQRGFWTQWRHRDPVKLAKELAWLYREHGVELINFADELPTGSRKAWRAFLEALIEENVPLTLVGSTRAGDIVRDKDILHLYKKAGVIRFLLGIESYDDETIKEIKKGADCEEDRTAIMLLREHGIISMATYVLGFKEESDIDYWRSYKHLVRYDPDQVQLLYATPHRWTPFYKTVENRKVILEDTNLWDYKHQVLEATRVPAWRVFIWFKLIEVFMQLRPKVLFRLLFHKLPEYRYAMRWYTRMGKRVWLHEVYEFIFKIKLLKNPPTLSDFMGRTLEAREYSMKGKTKRTVTLHKVQK